MMGGAHIARSTSYANIQLGLGAILGCKRPRVKFPQTQQELRAAIIEELNFLNWDFFFQAEDGIRDRSPSRGLGDVYKRQVLCQQCSVSCGCCMAQFG